MPKPFKYPRKSDALPNVVKLALDAAANQSTAVAVVVRCTILSYPRQVYNCHRVAGFVCFGTYFTCTNDSNSQYYGRHQWQQLGCLAFLHILSHHIEPQWSVSITDYYQDV
jgi:hypothetical protein